MLRFWSNRSATTAVGGTLFLIFSVVIARLSQRDFEFILEPDIPIDVIREWMTFLTTGKTAVFSRPFPYTNLDGQQIVCALATILVQFATSIFPKLEAAFPNDDSLIQVGVTLVNVVSYAGACVVFYATMFRVTRNIALSAALAVALLLSPQMLAINVIRSDFQISLPLMVVFYCSVVIAQGEERLRHAVLLGVSFGFLATIKISGLLFGLFPVFAMVSRAWPIECGRLMAWARLTLVAAGVFLICYSALMFRYVYHLSFPELLELYPKGAQVFLDWHTLYPWIPRSYYSYELLLGHGIEFIWLYVLSAVALCWFAFSCGDRVATFIVLSLAAFSVFSATTMKYSRGGYHLLPVLFAAIGLAIHHVRRSGWRPPIKALAVLIPCVALGSSLVRSVQFYQSRVSVAQARTIAIDQIYRAPHRWLLTHVPPLSKICIAKFSEWAFPPLAELNADVHYGPFDFPFVDPKAMAQYQPPTMAALESACDFVILNSIHVAMYHDIIRTQSPTSQDHWETFYTALADKFPPQVFSTADPAGLPAWIKIHDLGHSTRMLRNDVCDRNNPRAVKLGGSFAHLKGHTFVTRLSEHADKSDAPQDGFRSPLLLCEGSRLLGPAHSVHDRIHNEGHGRYSHWGDALLFSTSDNSDPNENGRSYRFVIGE
jgi:hypothetical protein